MFAVVYLHFLSSAAVKSSCPVLSWLSLLSLSLPEVATCLFSVLYSSEGRDSDFLRVVRSGDRILVGARFSAPVQTGPAARPPSYTMGTGSFPGVKRPGRGVDHPPHLTPRWKKEYGYTSTPLWAFEACYRVKFTFTFTICFFLLPA